MAPTRILGQLLVVTRTCSISMVRTVPRFSVMDPLQSKSRVAGSPTALTRSRKITSSISTRRLKPFRTGRSIFLSWTIGVSSPLPDRLIWAGLFRAKLMSPSVTRLVSRDMFERFGRLSTTWRVSNKLQPRIHTFFNVQFCFPLLSILVDNTLYSLSLWMKLLNAEFKARYPSVGIRFDAFYLRYLF